MFEDRISFDSEQKLDRHNKYGWYQFGKNSCQMCKSDKTGGVYDFDRLAYKKVWKDQKFEVRDCFSCGHRWSRAA